MCLTAVIWEINQSSVKKAFVIVLGGFFYRGISSAVTTRSSELALYCQWGGVRDLILPRSYFEAKDSKSACSFGSDRILLIDFSRTLQDVYSSHTSSIQFTLALPVIVLIFFFFDLLILNFGMRAFLHDSFFVVKLRAKRRKLHYTSLGAIDLVCVWRCHQAAYAK